MKDKLVSVFTPTNKTEWIEECYKSLVNQTYKNWEWIIFANGEDANILSFPAELGSDSRVTIITRQEKMGIGKIKKVCCDYAKGDILLELDHDDILVYNCIEKVVEKFVENPFLSLVYSNTAQINEDGSPNFDEFDGKYGWKYKQTTIDSIDYNECISFDIVSPHVLGYIWYAPNHVRAFSKEAYVQSGGYDEALIVLDDLDLMCRLYEVGNFSHINECLYLQRVHLTNSQKLFYPHLEYWRKILYSKYINSLCLKWSERNGLRCLDFGSAHNKPLGYEGVDIREGEGVDIIMDASSYYNFSAIRANFNNIEHGWEYIPSNSVGVIRMFDFMEHIKDNVFLMNQIYRVLAHGGMLLSMTPSTDGRGAFQDPTHISFWNENSFWYYTNEVYSKYVPEIKCKFMESKIETGFPTTHHQHHNIAYVEANLVAIKEGERIPGIINFNV